MIKMYAVLKTALRLSIEKASYALKSP